MQLKCGHADCVYRAKINSNDDFCSYILVEHHSRGCPVDEMCNKYRRGRRRLISEDLTQTFVEEITDDELL